MALNITNLINDDQKINMNTQFNSPELNFQDKTFDNQLSQLSKDSSENFISGQQLQKYWQRQNMLKEMFTLLAQNENVYNVISMMQNKYGSAFSQDLRNICQQFCYLIGNYFITCKYNDNLGKKNPNLVKYAIMCDCPDRDKQIVQESSNGGSVDGFFANGNKKISRVHFCHKHNLPVIANFDDLTQQEFAKLAKQVSQIKNVPIKQVKKNTDCKKVISKIARIFKNIVSKKVEAKIDTQSFKLKDANVQFKADVTTEFKQTEINDVEAPKGEKMSYTIADKFSNANINVPVNNVTVPIDKHASSIKQFAIKQQKYGDLQLANEIKSNVNLPSKNIEVAVQKQSKFVENISIYTEPIKTEFDLSDNYSFDLNKQNNDDIQIDTKGSFDF